jgi:hypothetical protein
MSDRQVEQVRQEAYRAAAAAVDRFLGRLDDSATDRVDQLGSAARDRFRAEMGRVVDLNLDMVRNAFGLYSSLIDPDTLGQTGTPDVLTLGPAVPGSDATAILWLHNFDDDPMKALAFVGSRLTATGYQPIDLPRWSFSPPTVSVPARAAVPVVVGVEVPVDTQAGSYTGTVSVHGQGRVGEAIEVRVEVVAASPVRHDSW